MNKLFNNRYGLITPTLAAVAVLWALPAQADRTQCMKAVAEKHYERLPTVCLDLPHRNHLKKLELMMTGDFNHYLGTMDKPSRAFSLLRMHAEKNDPDAQYMYGHLFGTVHRASESNWSTISKGNDNRSIDDYNAQVRAEAASWVARAAEAGHGIAMLEVAESELLRSFTSDDVDLDKALSIAMKAGSNNPKLADELIKRIKERKDDMR